MQMRKFGIALLTSVMLFGAVLMQSDIRSSAAPTYTVTEAPAVLEVQGKYGLYTEPSTKSKCLVKLSGGTCVQVTGITSNGWFQVDVGGIYYMQGAALNNPGTYDPAKETVTKPDQGTTNPGMINPINPGTGDLDELTEGSQLPTAISYMPVLRRPSMEVTLNSTTEIPGLIAEATGAHTDKVIVNSKVSAYLPLWNAMSDFLTEKGVYSYEEATINTCGISSIGKKYTLTFGHMSTIQEEEYVDQTVVPLALQFNVGSDYDKILAVHDWICNHVEYSYETASGKAGYDYRSAYDALTAGKTVCTGYALLFQKFMDIYEIPCYVATGNNHAWNIVQVDGRWYYLDCTNDDQKSGITRRYFLVGSSKAGFSSYGGVQLSSADYSPVR